MLKLNTNKMILIKFEIDNKQELTIPCRHVPRTNETVIISKQDYIVVNVEYDLEFDTVIVYLLSQEV